MIRTTSLFSLFLILSLSLYSCKSEQPADSPQTEKEFVQDLFNVADQRNQELFKEKFLPNMAFVTQMEKEFAKLKGIPYDPVIGKNKYKIIQQNGSKLYKKLAGQTNNKDGNQSTKIDWKNTSIKKITPKFHTIGDISGGELLVDINTNGVDCTLNFRGVYKIGDGPWKIFQYIDFKNCFNFTKK